MADTKAIIKVVFEIGEATGRKELDQLKLGAECVGITPSNLDVVTNVTDVLNCLKNNKSTSNEPIPILYELLTKANVTQSKVKLLLSSCTKQAHETCKQRRDLQFALLMIDICNGIEAASLKAFGNFFTDNMQKFPTIEKLLQSVIRGRDIWLDKLVDLENTLKIMGKRDILEKVEKFKKVGEGCSKAIGIQTKGCDAYLSEAVSSEKSQHPVDSANGIQTKTKGCDAYLSEAVSSEKSQHPVDSGCSIMEVTEQVGLTDADLATPVMQSNLYKVAECFRKEGVELAVEFGVQDKNDTAFRGLLKWHERQTVQSTYRDVVEILCHSNKKQVALDICTLLSGQLHGEDTVKPGNEDNETGQGTLYCLKQLTYAQELVIKPLSPHDLRAGGEVSLDKIWDMTQINGPLKVHFLNPEVLVATKKKWMCHGEPLTRTLILSWATIWNAHAEYYPKISDEIPKQDEAQIRVRLSTTKGCWSWVGRDAEKVDKSKPTMVLNLYNVRQPTQRNLVIHEFGHALGLGHEHQRSDFWAILGKKDKSGEYCFIDMKEMEDSVGIDHVHTFTELFQSGKLVRSKYDPQSIMHYWFDVGWLKEEYHNRRNIKYNDALSKEEKDVLEGIHQRDHKNGACRLPGGPSPTDYDTLNKAYTLGL